MDGAPPACSGNLEYLAIRYTERLAEIGAVTSVGPVGDSCDNAAAESLIGLFDIESIPRRGPGRGLDHVELATLERVDRFDDRRLHNACDDVPPGRLRGSLTRPSTGLGA